MSARRVSRLLFVLVFASSAPAFAVEPPPIDPAPAAAPALLHYQGRFADASGVALPGPVTLTFSLFAIPEGGAALWSETHVDVPLAEGIGGVLLGSIVTFPPEAFAAPGRYLEITVGSETLSPRLVVASAPFALEADRLDGKDASAFEPAGITAALLGGLSTSDGTPPNEGANKLHWDLLTGVPEGFADGVDDGGTGSTDHGELLGLSDDDHPQYLLRSDAVVGDGTPPNNGRNNLHWQNLVGVPEGFADGIDNVLGEGQLTGADVKDSSLTGIDIAPESITAVNLGPGSVTGAAISDGTIQPWDLAFPAGDITAVNAGAGLTGGGDQGTVTLTVGAGSGIQVVGSSVGLAPSYISGSAYDNRFVSRTAPVWTAQAGAVSVPGAAFRPVTPTGRYTVQPQEGYLYVDSASNSGAEDEFTAPIQLPHGAQITGFWVTFWDNTAASLSVSLRRARQNGANTTDVANVTTDVTGAAWFALNDAIITETAIDNVEFTYWLVADFPSTPQGMNLRLLSVRVNYTVTRPH